MLEFGSWVPWWWPHQRVRYAVSGPRRRALLVRLLVAANEVVSADQLTEDLWSGGRASAGGGRHPSQSYVAVAAPAGGAASDRPVGGVRAGAGSYDDELDLAVFEREWRAVATR